MRSKLQEEDGEDEEQEEGGAVDGATDDDEEEESAGVKRTRKTLGSTGRPAAALWSEVITISDNVPTDEETGTESRSEEEEAPRDEVAEHVHADEEFGNEGMGLEETNKAADEELAEHDMEHAQIEDECGHDGAVVAGGGSEEAA